MAKKGELDALRRQVLAERKKVTRRIRDIRRGVGSMSRNVNVSRTLSRMGYAGANITGTRFDPRPDVDRVGRMTRKQLQKVLFEMQEFRRTRQYYFRGAHGSIISGQTMFQAISATEEYNRQQRDYRAKVANRPVPWIGEGITAGQYDDDFRPKNTYLSGEAFYDVRERKLPNPMRFTSDDNAKLWVSSLKQKLTDKGHDERISSIRSQIRQMIEPLGDKDLLLRFENISDDDLYFIWTNDPTLANSLSLQYEHAMASMNDDVSIDGLHALAQGADNGRVRVNEILGMI